jgi:hypothetical protein
MVIYFNTKNSQNTELPFSNLLTTLKTLPVLAPASILKYPHPANKNNFPHFPPFVQFQ